MTTQLLLIDPDIAFMVTIKKALEGTGDYKVSVAANGWTADELLRHGTYDVAIVAFGLIDMDVMVLLQRLRQIQPDLPVVLTPATPDEHERAALMDAQGIIGRPYVTRDLLPVIDEAQQVEVRRSPRTIRRITPPEPEAEYDIPDESPLLSDTGPFSDSAAVLEEFEELERIQTGPLDEDEKPRDLPNTRELALQFDELFPSDPFDFQESFEDISDPRQTALLSDLPDDFSAGGTHYFDDDAIDEPPDTASLRELAMAAADIASGGQLLDDQDDGESEELPETGQLPESASSDEADDRDEIDLLDDIVIEEPPDTPRLQDMEEPPETTLLSADELPGGTRVLDVDEEPPELTRVLDDLDEPPDTTALLQWDEPEDTRRLSGTDALDHEQGRETQMLQWREEPHITDPGDDDTVVELADERVDYDPRPKTKPLGDLPGEPPRKPGDTPPVPEHDLDGVRQFLATDYSEQDPEDFGAALDAVARYETPAERSPEDRAFDDLVDSLRVPGQEVPRRTRLDDLLRSLAADAAKDLPQDRPETTLDFVLDAIRRGESPIMRGKSLPDDIDLDDTTIGQVIDGLFEPSFEGVLAALAGEEVDEETIDEPTYEPPESPHTLPGEGRDAAIHEPPIDPEDSRRYPATAALTAVTGEDDSAGGFSLDELLRQIETQLPPARTYRPRLKPLPSWEQSELITGRKDIEALFDHVEGVEPDYATPGDVAEVQDGIEPVFDDGTDAVMRSTSIAHDEPDISQDDTRPSAALLEAMDSVQQADTKPLGLVVPDGMYEPEPLETGDEPVDDIDFDTDTDDEAEVDTGPDIVPQPDMLFPGERVTEREEIDQPDSDQPEDEVLLTMDDLLAIADLPVDAGTEEIQEEIARRAAAAQQAAAQQAGVQQAADIPAEARDDDEAWAHDQEWDYEADDAALPDTVIGIDGVDRGAEERDAQPFEAGEEVDFHPDDSQMITVPADTAAWLIETEMSPVEEIEVEEEDALLATLAVQLTQFSLESSAQATIIARSGERLAEAGDLPDDAMDDLFDWVNEAWQSSPAETDSLIRFIALPDAGEFLLYSTLVEHDLTLSMVFHSDIPVRTIRRQARRLSESLDLVPDVEEPVASQTLPSRPTDFVPPEGWQETIESHGLAGNEVSAPLRPDRDADGPYTAYTCLWLTADPALELQDDFADGLARWIEFIADDSAWFLGDLEIMPDYILLTLHAPQKMLPDEVITLLMSETERLASEHFPMLANGRALWTDGYYVVSPPRDLSEREIARFITYQRQAQLG